MPRATLAKKVGVMHLASYAMLVCVWLPLAYHSSRHSELEAVAWCGKPGGWADYCKAVFEKHPKVLEQRLQACSSPVQDTGQLSLNCADDARRAAVVKKPEHLAADADVTVR